MNPVGPKAYATKGKLKKVLVDLVECLIEINLEKKNCSSLLYGMNDFINDNPSIDNEPPFDESRLDRKNETLYGPLKTSYEDFGEEFVDRI